ncbi:MAG: type I restriction endonuclease subunit R, partial [Prevotellaceae bacterium]|nr:type I restriction endonuclease subunit R [Prevotellaceae bacterium]
FGNIVTFRDLEQDTVDAISLFGDKNTKNVVLEKSYTEQLQGFTDAVTGEERRGFAEIVAELCTRFPDPDAIEKEADKKAFVKLFGEYLKAENILQNYDEFAQLKAFAKIDATDEAAVEAFKAEHFLTDEDLAALREIELPDERKLQDYRSTYNDIREWKRVQDAAKRIEKPKVDWDDVVFEVELLKSQEFTLDYILELVFEHSRRSSDKQGLVEEVRRTLRASLGNRAKEGLMVDFINRTDLQALKDKDEVMDAFYTYARERRDEEVETLIEEEQLNTAAAKRFIRASLKRELVSENGTDLSEALPKMSPLHPAYVTKKQSVFQKIVAFVEKFKGIGGEL